jgi:cell wall-associated NlpC family hydrolase
LTPQLRRLAFSLLVAAIGAALLSPAASADPLASKRAQAEAVMAQVQELDASVGLAVERYNSARLRLDEILEKQRENQRYLRIAKSSFKRAQKALQRRLLALYTSGSPSTLEILLGASSLGDLLDRANAVSRVSEQDARVLRELKGFRAEVKRREAELKEARSEQEAVVADLQAQRREIEAALAERRQLLATIESEIERIKEAERRRQEQLAAQARQQVTSSSSTNGGGGGGGTSPSSSYSGSEAVTGAAPPARYGGVVGIAMRYLGIPYRWGGSSPSTGFDCSGFIMYVFAQVGVSLPHSAAAQYGYGAPVARSNLQPGDLVFFNGLGHNGIYIGGGSMIHSPHTGDVVKISNINSGWYASTYVGARRL